MPQNKELWSYNENEQVWVGKYQNSQNISHWHNDCELIYVCQGNIDIMHDKTPYSLSAGQSFFIESKKIHNMHATSEETIIMIIVFDNDIVKNIIGNYELESPLLTFDYKITNLYHTLYNELTKKPFQYENKTKNLIRQLLIDIMRNESIKIKKKEKKINERLMFLLNDIDKNYPEYTLEKAAKLIKMNTSYFSRFFNNAVGIPFSKYLNCVKVENAVNLIHNKNDYSITEIGLMCGFQTIRNFNRIFKEYTGYSPSLIPDNYIFNGLNIHSSGKNMNPTLSSCKLIEFSSPRN
jgi:AraC-like DNA-binding protein